jgi:cytochrome c-type biogenesis protein CcmH
MSGLRRLHASRSAVLVAMAVLAAAVTLAMVGLRGPAPAQSQEQIAHDIASGLRCPVCADLSAADSPAPLARQMRTQIADKLAHGDSPEEIRQSFIAAYGSSVLMTPPREGLGRLVYAFPFLALVVALGAGGVLLRRTLRPGPTNAAESRPARLTEADRRRVELALDRLRVEEP